MNSTEIHFSPNVVILDPISIRVRISYMYNCVKFITKGDKSTKILFALN